jgi:hypothetical protein
MWILGAEVVSRMLPSFSTSTTAPESATRKFAPLMPISAARNFWRSTERAMAVCFSITVSRGTLRRFGEKIGHLVTGQVQRRRHDVVGPLVRQLHDVLAEIGLHRFQAVVFEALVEIHLLGGHRLGFDDQPRAAVFGQRQHEIGDFRAVLGVHHLAAMGFDVALELLEIVIQVLDGVLLDGVGLGAQLLVIGQRIGRTVSMRLSFSRAVAV